MPSSNTDGADDADSVMDTVWLRLWLILLMVTFVCTLCMLSSDFTAVEVIGVNVMKQISPALALFLMLFALLTWLQTTLDRRIAHKIMTVAALCCKQCIV